MRTPAKIVLVLSGAYHLIKSGYNLVVIIYFMFSSKTAEEPYMDNFITALVIAVLCLSAAWLLYADQRKDEKIAELETRLNRVSLRQSAQGEALREHGDQ